MKRGLQTVRTFSVVVLTMVTLLGPHTYSDELPTEGASSESWLTEASSSYFEQASDSWLVLSGEPLFWDGLTVVLGGAAIQLFSSWLRYKREFRRSQNELILLGELRKMGEALEARTTIDYEMDTQTEKAISENEEHAGRCNRFFARLFRPRLAYPLLFAGGAAGSWLYSRHLLKKEGVDMSHYKTRKTAEEIQAHEAEVQKQEDEERQAFIGLFAGNIAGSLSKSKNSMWDSFKKSLGVPDEELEEGTKRYQNFFNRFSNDFQQKFEGHFSEAFAHALDNYDVQSKLSRNEKLLRLIEQGQKDQTKLDLLAQQTMQRTLSQFFDFPEADYSKRFKRAAIETFWKKMRDELKGISPSKARIYLKLKE